MESIFSLLFGVIGITSLIVHYRSRQDLANYLSLLVSLAVVILSGKGLSSDNSPSMLTLILVIALTGGFVLSRIAKLRSSFWPWIIPLLLSFLPIVVGEKVFTYYAFDLNFRGSILALFPLGVLLPALGSKIAQSLKKWSVEQQELSNAISLLSLGTGIFAGYFFGSYYGILLVATGMTLTSFFGIQINRNATVGLSFISLMPLFMETGGVETIDLSFGETITGIFFGAFTVYFLHWLSTTRLPKSGILIGLITGILLLSMLLFLGTQKTDLGGADAFIAAFIGVALALSVLPAFRLAETLVSFLTATAIITLPMTVEPANETLSTVSEPTNGSIKKAEEPSLYEGENISMDSITGDYRINEKTVQLKFRLGPKGGVTKGAFRSFGGKVSIKKEVTNSTFSIELPFSQLTTFNQYRDESLAEEGYFNAAKYPTMNYVSKKLTKKDGHYLLEGNFTMLGISKPLNIELKYFGMVGSDQTPVLVGRSSIDRNQFGMKPDSKEGNVVDFEFRVELSK